MVKGVDCLDRWRVGLLFFFFLLFINVLGWCILSNYEGEVGGWLCFIKEKGIYSVHGHVDALNGVSRVFFFFSAGEVEVTLDGFGRGSIQHGGGICRCCQRQVKSLPQTIVFSKLFHLFSRNESTGAPTLHRSINPSSFHTSKTQLPVWKITQRILH